MNWHRFIRIAQSFAISLVPATSVGCPFCVSETGAQVRSALFGQDVWLNLAAVASPLVLSIGVVACICTMCAAQPESRPLNRSVE
jgi:hypothetical protein